MASVCASPTLTVTNNPVPFEGERRKCGLPARRLLNLRSKSRRLFFFSPSTF